MRVLVTGATGFVGQHLVQNIFQDGHEISILARNPQSVSEKLGLPCRTFMWNALQSHPPIEAFQSVDAVIHLAGEPIAEKRWDSQTKIRIRESRVRGTHHLIQALKDLGPDRPKVFISASAIGYYGNRGDEILTEETAPGSDFLAEVCKEWEEQSKQACDLGIRTVIFRLGLVLGKNGGALAKILPFFNAGLGGKIGNGSHWVSWIHLLDLIEVIRFALKNPSCEGIYNAVAPNPIRNREFTDTLAGILGKKAFLHVPHLALHLRYGEMATLLTSSQRVKAEQLEKLGFEYKFPTLQIALKEIV